MLRPELDRPFLSAAGRGDLEFLQKHTKDEIGKDLIHLALKEACLNKRRDVVSWLMGMGAWDLEPGLLGACQSGDVNLVKMMIQDGAINWTEGYVVALLEGHQGVVELFEALNDAAKASSAWLPKFYSFVLDGKPIEESAFQPEYPMVDYDECLKRLCDVGSSELVGTLLAKKAIPIETRHLQAACGSGNLNLVQFLMNKGTHFDLDEAFLGAIEGKQLDVIKFLLVKGIKPTEEMATKAVQTGDYPISELICSMVYPKVTNGRKREPRRYGCSSDITPLEMLGDDMSSLCKQACRGGNPKIVEMILTEYGAVNSALDFRSACASGHQEVIDYVLARDNFQVWRGLSGAIETEDVQLIEYVIEKIEEEGPPTHYRYTDSVLSFALQTGNMNLVEKMLAKGSEIIRDSFASAAIGGYMKMIQFVLDKLHGKLPKNDFKGSSSLSLYRRAFGRYDTSRFLLEHGFSVPGNYWVGSTPLATGAINLMLQVTSMTLHDQLWVKRTLQQSYPYSWKNFTRNIAKIVSVAVERETSKDLPPQLLRKIMRFANLHDLPSEFVEEYDNFDPSGNFDPSPAILNGEY